MATPRDTFPLRFKRPQTREALKQLAAAEGMSMTDAAEQAIEHEVALLGLDVERRLTEALSVIRSYTAADTEDYLAAIAAGERSGLDPMRDITAAHAAAPAPVPLEDPHGILAAFARH
jgi:hypothetical protein